MLNNKLWHRLGEWAIPVVLATVGMGTGANTLRAADPPKVAAKVDDPSRLGSSKHPLSPAIELAKSSRDEAAKLKDYRTLFIKRERIKGQVLRQTLDMKFRTEPKSVYLRFQDPHPGREVIYVDGLNRGNLLVHEEGIKSLAGTLSLSPTHDDAMKESRYPITMSGMVTMVETILKQWEQETKFGEIDVQFAPSVKVGDYDCKTITSTHPALRPHFRFHKTVLYIDNKTNLPVRVEQYGFPQAGQQPPLVEEYTFAKLQTNVGFTNNDFDPRNREYKFR